MPPFPRPRFDYTYDLATELVSLRRWEGTEPGRDVPDKRPDHVLIATWNVANLGLHKRRSDDCRIIAELMSWFDLIAVQEVNDNLDGLRSVHAFLPERYRLLFSDRAGNNKRLAFVYDARKVRLLEKVGEIAIPPKETSAIKLPGVSTRFLAFDRNPYLAAFRAGSFTFVLVNVHLYFGEEGSAASIARRSLEAYAVARWADTRRRSKNVYAKDIITMGDFNLPKATPEDPVYRALTRRGLKLPKHSTAIGSSIKTDSHYDQVAFFPGETSGEYTGRSGVFDFDGALFKTLWDAKPADDFFAYMRYYVSDHRILWAEFRTA